MFYKITAAVFTCLSLGIIGVRAICISIILSSKVQAVKNEDSIDALVSYFDKNTHLMILAAVSLIIGLILFVIGLFSRKKKS